MEEVDSILHRKLEYLPFLCLEFTVVWRGRRKQDINIREREECEEIEE
jgi:hypothetical protein